jgi:hypothetical protein
MFYYEGEAVWNGLNTEEKRHDVRITYQLKVPYENHQRWIGLPITAVNIYGHKTEQLPPGYIAVHPPDRIYPVAV